MLNTISKGPSLSTTYTFKIKKRKKKTYRKESNVTDKNLFMRNPFI